MGILVIVVVMIIAIFIRPWISIPVILLLSLISAQWAAVALMAILLSGLILFFKG